MTRSDRELARRFKEEADELWFRDVRFDDALKQKVRDRIGEDRAAVGRSMRARRTALGALALASAAALLLVIVPLLSPDRQPASTAILFGEDGPESAPFGTAGDTFAMEGATMAAPFSGGTSTEGPAAREGVSWSPLTEEEAAEAFGPGFALPGWLPDGFSLRRIGAFGEREGEACAVTMTYMSEDRTFWLTLRKAERPEIFPAWQTVDVGGVVGYLNAAPPPGGMPAVQDGTDGAPIGAPPAEEEGTVPAVPFPDVPQGAAGSRDVPPDAPQGAASGAAPVNVSPDTPQGASSNMAPADVPPEAPQGAVSGKAPAHVPPDAPRGTRPGTDPANVPPAAPWPTAELYWFAGGIQYALHGAITGEEAVKIARSIPLATGEDGIANRKLQGGNPT